MHPTARLALIALGVSLWACVPEPQEGDDSAGTGDDGGTGDGGGGDGGSTLADLDPSTLPNGDNPCRAPAYGVVEYTVDGDTIQVDLDNAGSERVRIIGVDTPESYGDVECYGAEASLYTAQELEGAEVWLTFDGTCTDTYDRTLAYVHTGNRSEEDFFERRLLRNGYAETLNFDDTDTYKDAFAADMQAAKDANKGLWGACN